MNILQPVIQGQGGSLPPFAIMGLGRLDVLPPVSLPTVDPHLLDQPDWEEVHLSVQCIFTYRTFDLGVQAEFDPVIVGLSFDPVPLSGGIMVRGDIGGEGTGRIDFELAERSLRLSRWDILPVALEMATQLGEQKHLIARSVFKRHPLADY